VSTLLLRARKNTFESKQWAVASRQCIIVRIKEVAITVTLDIIMKQGVLDEQLSFSLRSLAGASGANANRASRGHRDPLIHRRMGGGDQDNAHLSQAHTRALRTLSEALDRHQAGGLRSTAFEMPRSSRPTLQDILQQALDMVVDFESDEDFDLNLQNSNADASPSRQGSLK
jgi:hypothetical protein